MGNPFWLVQGQFEMVNFFNWRRKSARSSRGLALPGALISISPVKHKKATARVAFSFLAGGEGLISHFLCSTPSGRTALRSVRPNRLSCRFVEPRRPSAARGSQHALPGQTQKNRLLGGFFVFGWGRGIRTPAGGVRVRSPTTRRSPKGSIPLLMKLCC